MKLEAGKRYRLRDGDIEKCLAVWCEEVQGYQATVTWFGTQRAYTLDGHFYQDKTESPRDIIAEYREPRKYEVWVNLYFDGTCFPFRTKDQADKSRSKGKKENGEDDYRVECRKIEWEVDE